VTRSVRKLRTIRIGLLGLTSSNTGEARLRAMVHLKVIQTDVLHRAGIWLCSRCIRDIRSLKELVPVETIVMSSGEKE
jgi:hypothetical protein